MWPKTSVIALSLLLTVVVCLQQKIDLSRNKLQAIDSFSHIPPSHIVKFAALEFKEVTADILWLRAVQFLGDRKTTTPRYDLFYKIIDLVTDLDPRFTFAYQAGAIALSVLSDNVHLSNPLLEKGMHENPYDWQLPFYLGFNYMYHLKNPLKAAYYMAHAGKLEGCPEYIPLLAAHLYNKGGEPETAILFLKGIYLTTRDEKTRKQIAERIAKMEKELVSKKNKGPTQ
ncbi:MAG: hypothetical protein HY037_06060 [Nitrospirae bacterium]|nr:hypothetical protein [Candidatus Troglogloeales bacterium]